MTWLAWSKRIFLLLMLLVIKETEARETYCLQKTRLTVFTDAEYLFGNTYSNIYDYPFIVSVIKTVLRDQCYKGRLYDQTNRKFIKINDVEDIRSDFEKLSHNFQPIKRDEMYSFVDEFYGEINNTNGSREIIFYLYDEHHYTLSSYMELKEISKNPKVSIIIGCLTFERRYGSEKFIDRFPELAWLPVHRFILITNALNLHFRYILNDEFNREHNGVPICFQSILGLLRNPNFNRFEYHSNTLLPDTHFPMTIQNLTIYFQSNLGYFLGGFFIKEDTDALLQLMVFLKKKLLQLDGTKFFVVMKGDENASVMLLYQKLGFEVIQDQVISDRDLPDLKFDSLNDIDYSDSLITVYPEDLLTDKSLKLWMKAIINTVESDPRKGEMKITK
uniref:Cnidarian restricted protein n=1 Tax=Clytia hemisphaerica TaxID=252671 RepID=A0A7M5VAC1_9CNID